jgi:uroporphyrinogen-III synthase
MTTLAGKTIAVTRATHQFAEVALAIQHMGGQAISFPTIAIHTAPSVQTDLDTIKQLMSGAYDWVVFTSVNGVTHLPHYAQQLQRTASIHLETRIAAIGHQTAQRIRAVFQRDVDFMPVTANAANMFGELTHRRPTRVCWVCGNLANIQPTPYPLDRVVVYQTACATDGPRFAHIQDQIDAIVFQSGSAVHNFVSRLQHEHIDIRELSTIRFAYQGATAYRMAHVLNLPRHFYSESTDSATFIAHLANYLAQENQHD